MKCVLITLMLVQPDFMRSIGGGRDGLNLKIIRAVVVTLPKFEEQIAIVLSSMDARRDKARALRQDMMQELLTGRIWLV